MNRNGIDTRLGVYSLVLAICGLTSQVLGQSTGSAQYEVYKCRHKKAAAVEKLLIGLIPADADFHLVSDAKSNSLLLRGSDDIQAVAVSFLQQVDRPESRSRESRPQQSVVKAYSANASQLDAKLRAVREFCADHDNVRVTVAPETSQIFVLGPPAIQNQIQALLATQSNSPRHLDNHVTNQAAEPLGAHTPDRKTLGPPVERVLHLRLTEPGQIEQNLLALFGRRLQARRQQGRQVFVLPLGTGNTIEFQVDAQLRAVVVRGPDSLVEQFTRLVDAFDVKRDLGYQTRALHIERTAPGQVQKAIDAIRSDPPSRSSFGSPASNDQSAINRREASRGPVRLVNYLFQEGQAGGDSGAAGVVSEGLAPSMPSGPGLQDLEIQTLPDLDVIIVRGRDQDVRQFEQIIRELERLSLETRPKIQIYWLKHTLGDSVKEIVDEVQADLIGGRQGKVSVTVLGKPNALLLIGWGEAVESITELIEKLDRPVAPETQFYVFALKHASATTVDQTIAEFFSNRPGLGPDVQTAMDSRTNSIIVYAAPRDMLEVKRLVESMDVTRSESVNQAKIIELQNTLASDVSQTLQQAISAASTGQAGRAAVLELVTLDDQGEKVLQSGMLNEVNITPNPRNNTLIVTGPPDAMALVEAFIKQLDKPGDRALLKVFRVKNGDATNLVMMLRSLIPSQIGQAIGPQLPSAPEENSLVPLRFSVEVRSNSIIAVGSEGDLRLVEGLLTRLDESESMNRRNAVYLLKNAPAVEVATTVNEFLRSQRTLEAAEPGQSNPFQDLEREVIVVAEPVRNRLVVSATPRYFDEITQLIEKLDEPPPQVMIQVLIAEVVLDDMDELGFELGIQDSVLFDRSLLDELVTTTRTTNISDANGIITTTQEVIQSATNTPGFEFNNDPLGNSGSEASLGTASRLGGQALSSFALGRVSSDLDYGGLVLSASSQNISMLIRALQETRQIRILSRPTVRTLDNQPAFIQVGQRVPRITGSNVNQNGQSNTVALENVGLILGVTPRISPGGNVVMEIDAEKSKVGPEDEGIPVSVSFDGTIVRSPRVDTVTAQATVSAADRETVILGGMIETRQESVQRRAPFLSEIPVLGHLFRFDSTEERRTELLIMLTPRVVNSPEDGDAIKQAEFARMNWCAADVYDVYGDIGIQFQSDVALPVDGDCTTEVIYPDLNPRGNPQPQDQLQPRLAPQPGQQPYPTGDRQYQDLPPVPNGDIYVPPERGYPQNPEQLHSQPGVLPPAPIRQPTMPNQTPYDESRRIMVPGRGPQHVSSRPIRQPVDPPNSNSVYGPQPWNYQNGNGAMR